MRSSHVKSKGAVILLLVAFLALPIRKLFVEDWSVRVSDQNGIPTSHIRVSLEWENYTFNFSGGDELYTDADGTVTFPRQALIRPICYWIAKAAWTFLNLGVHTSLGTAATVQVSDPDRLWSVDQSGNRSAGANCADANCTMSKLHSELRIQLVQAQ